MNPSELKCHYWNRDASGLYWVVVHPEHDDSTWHLREGFCPQCGATLHETGWEEPRP